MPDPRRHLIQLYRDYFKSKRGFDCETPFGAMMNMMYHKFEVVDQKTGEIFIEEYPKEENWLREIEGFFEDAFAFKTNYSFIFFLKAYGKFGLPPKRNVLQLLKQVGQPMRSVTNPNEAFRCKSCGNIHSPQFKCQ